MNDQTRDRIFQLAEASPVFVSEPELTPDEIERKLAQQAGMMLGRVAYERGRELAMFGDAAQPWEELEESMQHAWAVVAYAVTESVMQAIMAADMVPQVPTMRTTRRERRAADVLRRARGKQLVEQANSAGKKRK